ncbi:lipase family protein [Priestia megaterium]|nr:lipase family protein [Priestia megaterium]
MKLEPLFYRPLALDLLYMCVLAYKQYKQNGIFDIPPGYQFVQSIQASAIVRKEWFGFILESDDAIVIAFRGTQSEADWIADARIHQRSYPYTENAGRVHEGFLSIYESCREEIFTTYSTLPAKPLYITGHSLGAALAILHALDVATNTSFPHITMYNFASPRVGDQQFVQTYTQTVSNSRSFINTTDLVPKLPPKRLYNPYNEQMLYYEDDPLKLLFTIQTGSTTENHSPKTYSVGVWTMSDYPIISLK